MPQSFALSDALDVEIDRFYTHLERGMTIELIGTFEHLRECSECDDLRTVVTAEETHEFDHLPVLSNGSYVGLLPRADWEQRLRSGEELPLHVAGAMHHLGERNLIAAEASLLEFLTAADASPARLVLKGRTIAGIVTISDLHKLPVRTSLLVLLTHFELQLTAVLRQRQWGGRMFAKLPPQRASLAAARWTMLRDSNRAIDEFGALDLRDKHTLLLGTGDVLKTIGREYDKAERELADIYDLRNGVVHARDYALSQADIVKLAATVRNLRTWTLELGALI